MKDLKSDLYRHLFVLIMAIENLVYSYCKVTKKSHIVMKYADKHKVNPDKRVSPCRGEGGGWRLVEAEAGDVGGWDDVGVVGTFF